MPLERTLDTLLCCSFQASFIEATEDVSKVLVLSLKRMSA